MLEVLRKLAPTTIIHGGASGADALASECCLRLGVPCEVYKAKWSVYGKAAGPIRNAVMIATKPDLVVAFWDGRSRGTLDCMTQARAAGIAVKVVAYD
jgi:hypothetical protein